MHFWEGLADTTWLAQGTFTGALVTDVKVSSLSAGRSLDQPHVRLARMRSCARLQARLHHLARSFAGTRCSQAGQAGGCFRDGRCQQTQFRRLENIPGKKKKLAGVARGRGCGGGGTCGCRAISRRRRRRGPLRKPVMCDFARAANHHRLYPVTTREGIPASMTTRMKKKKKTLVVSVFLT